MPSRVIREGILTSERVNKLGAHAELFYRRLMSVVDDYGRYYAHPAILRSACYPLRVDVVREADISRWLTEVELAGLIALYAVDSKRYLEMIDFRQHVRAKDSKFPGPQCLANAKQMQSKCEADAKQMQTEFASAPTTTTHPPPDVFVSSLGKGDARGKTFLPPTVEDVAAYCIERGNSVDAEAFIAYYTANGWVQGNSRKPIRNWRAAVQTWEKNDFRVRNGTGDPRGNFEAARIYEEKYGDKP